MPYNPQIESGEILGRSAQTDGWFGRGNVVKPEVPSVYIGVEDSFTGKVFGYYKDNTSAVSKTVDKTLAYFLGAVLLALIVTYVGAAFVPWIAGSAIAPVGAAGYTAIGLGFGKTLATAGVLYGAARIGTTIFSATSGNRVGRDIDGVVLASNIAKVLEREIGAIKKGVNQYNLNHAQKAQLNSDILSVYKKLQDIGAKLPGGEQNNYRNACVSALAKHGVTVSATGALDTEKFFTKIAPQGARLSYDNLFVSLVTEAKRISRQGQVVSDDAALKVLFGNMEKVLSDTVKELKDEARAIKRTDPSRSTELLNKAREIEEYKASSESFKTLVGVCKDSNMTEAMFLAWKGQNCNVRGCGNVRGDEILGTVISDIKNICGEEISFSSSMQAKCVGALGGFTANLGDRSSDRGTGFGFGR